MLEPEVSNVSGVTLEVTGRYVSGVTLEVTDVSVSR